MLMKVGKLVDRIASAVVSGQLVEYVEKVKRMLGEQA